MAERIRSVAAAVEAKTKSKVAHLVGTMIEIPRACLVAEAIARERSSSRSGPTTSRR